MARKTGLGRGLDALISGSLEKGQQTTAGVAHIPVGNIVANPRQPRSKMDTGELDELAASIREHVIIQPIILTRSEIPDRFVLVAGERRLVAARQAGLSSVPAILRDASEQERLELALIENLQRADLGPLETADAFRQLGDDFGLTHDQISQRVGKSRAAVTNTLRLLKLPPSVQEALEGGEISAGHARALLALPNTQAQVAALKTILNKGLNVRKTEELVERLKGQKQTTTPKPGPSPEVIALEERLESNLGFPVSLNRRKKGGTLVIQYYNDEDLNTLVEKLTGDLD